MPHLAVIRRGWENEHLSAYILSKIAFVAQPAKIGDDVGADFFCTFFDEIFQGRKEYLVPRNSFAIQIKSSGNSVKATKQIEYLMRLELPFFVGILDQEHETLKIYSGEYLPILFSYKPKPKSLILQLVPNHDFEIDYFFEDMGANSYKLKCPLITTLSSKMTSENLVEKRGQLSEVASRIHSNIASQSSQEYIFNVGRDGVIPMIMAGSGSVKVFRDNFKKRLAEVFFNLLWIDDNQKNQLDISECKFYEWIYNEMRKREDNLPIYLLNVAEDLKKRLKSK